MESKFHENGVITGIADSFCLSCQKYLKLKDVQIHIAQPAHQNTFQSTAYVENYEKERIRKVKMGYYCEMCNLVMQTLAKTKIHINEITHVNNKNTKLLIESDNGIIAFDDILIERNSWHGLSEGSCLICNKDYCDENDHINDQTHILNLIQSKFELNENESDNGIIAFDDILIERNSWHGLSEGSCLICNKDYCDENDHINDQTHILNLIQSKFELNENEYVYRKIDGDSYNCLVCNIIIAKDSKTAHFNQPDHKKNYIKCQENKKSLNTAEKHTNAYDGVNKVKCDESNNGLKEVDSEHIVESETQIACYNNEKNNNKINDKDDDELLHPAEALKRAIDYAKKNNLTYKRNGTYCKYCDVKISSSLKMMKEHVEESSHKEKAQNKTNKKLQKVPMLTFIDSESYVESFFYYYIIINDEFCLSELSFNMINTHGNRMRCHVCDVTIDSREVQEHKRTFKHVNAMQVTPVLTDFKTEFVRELRPKVYHCGYCNFIEASLDCMKKHLESINHSEKKFAAKRCLQNLLPAIIDERRERMIRKTIRNYLSSK